MPATYTGAGGIFTLLGKHVAWFYALKQYASGSAFSSTAGDISKGLDHLEGAESAFANDKLERANWGRAKTVIGRQKRQVGEQMPQQVRGVIDNLMTTVVRDELDAKKGASARDVARLLAEQMSADGAAILKNTVAVSSISASPSNVGPARIYVSLTDVSGTANQAVLSDAFRVTCIDDELDGSDPGEEVLEITSETSPKTLAISPLFTESDDGNRLSNANFESASGSLPVSWTIEAGTTGKVSLTTGSAVFLGSLGLQFSGDGSTAYKVTQSVGALATPLEPGRYLLGFDLQGDWTTGGAVVSVKLVGTGWSSDAILVSTPPSSFADQTTWVSLPRNYPADLKVEILASGLASGVYARFDNFSLGKGERLGGLDFAARRGATDYRKGDRWDLAATNTYASICQTFFTRDYFGPGEGVRLPASSSPTIANTLFQ